jgi:hypothetical protein
MKCSPLHQRVHDSTPSTAFCRALETIIKRRSAEELAAERGTTSLLGVLLVTFLEWYLSLPPIAARLKAAYGLWAIGQQAPKVPMLFLYSKLDRLVPAEQVEAFIQSQVSILWPATVWTRVAHSASSLNRSPICQDCSLWMRGDKKQTGAPKCAALVWTRVSTRSWIVLLGPLICSVRVR